MRSQHIFGSRRSFLRRSACATLSAAVAGRPSSAAAQGPVAEASEASGDAARLAKIQPSHPRLHFDTIGRRALVARAGGTHRRYAQHLFGWIDRYQQWTPPRELPESSGNEVALEETAAFVTNAALAFVLSDEDKHLEISKRWALQMCELPQGGLRNYGLGVYAAGLARAYDWLFEHWSAEERERIRDHLSHLVRQVYLGSFPRHQKRHWWADAHLHHDFWIPVGGYGEAALALLGEVGEASSWAARAKHLLSVSMSWLGDDGAWHEGAADWCYTLAPLLWFYGAWQTAVGEDLHQVPWLQNTAAYRLYHWLPDDTYVYLNDSFRSGRYNTSGSASCHLLRRLAALFSDGRAQWLAARDELVDLAPNQKGVYQAPYERSSLRRARTLYPHPDSQCAAWNVLWYDPRVEAVAPQSLPVSHHFVNMGVAVLRTGWGSQDAVASLACGPLAGHRCAERMRAGEARTTSNYSHAHVDYGSFSLFANGEYFIVPAGYARRSSHFQNTVSVNSADLLPDAALDVRILAAHVDKNRGYSYVVADATSGYSPHLEVASYRRHMMLLSGGHCLVFDDLRLKARRTRSWNQFQWSVHSDPQEHRVVASGPTLTWHSRTREQPQLTLRVFEPREFAWEQAKLDPLDGEPMLEAHRLIRPEWYSESMQVLVAMSWTGVSNTPTLIQHPQFLALAVDDGLAIGFARRPMQQPQATRVSDDALQERELLLFGWDKDDPSKSVSIQR